MNRLFSRFLKRFDQWWKHNMEPRYIVSIPSGRFDRYGNPIKPLKRWVSSARYDELRKQGLV